MITRFEILTYRIEISEAVKNLLDKLSVEDRGKCRSLALLLLRLKKDHRPKGSRILRPVGTPIPGSRVWRYPGFEITYRVNDKDRSFFVSEVLLLK